MELFIDTHFSKHFSIAAKHEGKIKYKTGTNAAKEILPIIQELTHGEITKIYIIKGPGSLTGLRIGSACAMGLACGKNIPIKALSLWDILLSEHPNAQIFFHTGTKKWISKNINEEIIKETELETNKLWISNKPEKLQCDMKNNIPYPEIIKLMPKYAHLATNDTKLIYSVTLF